MLFGIAITTAREESRKGKNKCAECADICFSYRSIDTCL
jgi:hypothetical protein